VMCVGVAISSVQVANNGVDRPSTKQDFFLRFSSGDRKARPKDR
jgi:hypothetical protein